MTTDQTSLSQISQHHQVATRRALKQIATLGVVIILAAIIAGVLIG